MTEPRAFSLRDWLILIIVSLGLFLPGFANLPPTDRDESRYLVTSERMADTGDLVDLRYQQKPRYLQPAGIYWLQSASAAIFDSPAHDSVWPYRMPSLLGALAAVLMTGWLGARFFGREAGLAAAALLAACFSLNFEARIAKIDAMLLCSIVVAQLALMRAYLDAAPGRANAVVFWAALGAGLMLKGPIILVFVGATIAGLAIWDRKAGWLKNLHAAWGPLITLAICLPWYVAIGVITDGAFYTRSLMVNFLGKVGAGEQGHSGPIGYHIGVFLLVFWPGSLFALRALGFAWRERVTPAVRFLLCWIVPGWIVYEFVATKLPHYVLPTYPAIALLAAAAMFDDKALPASRTRSVLFVILALAWLIASALMSAAAPAAGWYADGIVNPVAAALGVLAFAAAAATLWLLWRGKKLAAIGAMTLSAILVWGNLYGYVLTQSHALWISPRVNAAARAARPCPEDQRASVFATIPYDEPSLVFLYGREETRLVETGAEAADVLARNAQCGLALVGAAEREDFLARARELGVMPREVDHITGRNYSNGDALDLTLYTTAAGEPRASE